MAAPTVCTQQGLHGGAMVQSPCDSISTKSFFDDELKECRITSTVDSLETHSLRSTYHIYHKKDSHASITPSTDFSKERFWGPTVKETKAKRKQKKLEKARQKEGLAPVVSTIPKTSEDVSFFLHTPYLAFHGPPRVLYIGDTKHNVPAVLIHHSCLWRKWKLQLGPSIAKSGVLDPRGVVSWQFNGGDKKTLKTIDTLLKGYKVRTWRLWGETGKKYVHSVKANREAGIRPDPDVIEESTTEKPSFPTHAEEVVYLEWTSPFSRNTRRYHFRYAGIDFYWKGTGTVKETRCCGWFNRYNHLKLVAQLHTTEGKDIVPREVCLGKYTSSIAQKKNGTLELFDGAIWRLMSEKMPAVLAQARIEKFMEDKEGSEMAATQVAMVKRTLFYQTIVATALCMVIGEKQKRETVRKIVEAILTEGAVGAGT